jgi:hypothetical protein
MISSMLKNTITSRCWPSAPFSLPPIFIAEICFESLYYRGMVFRKS